MSKTWFFLKDKNPHMTCQIYEGICSRGENYVGEKERNVETRWAEHEKTLIVTLNPLNIWKKTLPIIFIGNVS